MASTSSRDPATAVTGGTESTLVVELIRAFTTPVGSSSIQMRRTSTPASLSLEAGHEPIVEPVPSPHRHGARMLTMSDWLGSERLSNPSCWRSAR